jgi:iron complex outermembrane receptor protein
VGARLDVLDYEDPVNATTRDATTLNPLLGLVYSPVSDLALHASWGTASAPPSTQVVGPRDPEESRQLEMGAKVTFPGGKGFASVAVYDLKREGIAIPDSTGITRQSGDQRSRGVEVDLSATPAKGWVGRLAYAFTDAELTRFSEIVPMVPPDFVVMDRSGNRAPFAPRHLVSLWTSKRFDSGLGIALGLRAASEQMISEDNRYSIAGYATLDAAVSYEIGRLGLRAHLRNLTGSEYATRGFGAVSAIPARPFEASLHADLRFGRR